MTDELGAMKTSAASCRRVLETRQLIYILKINLVYILKITLLLAPDQLSYQLWGLNP